ncbi:hypothetical protein B0O99DRAFT_600255 [Bisporella sp. PMI_857]|nr:hypothetical protein B0O99DRAFT_600255 [Bisporella sp. PMI_857]
MLFSSAFVGLLLPLTVLAGPVNLLEDRAPIKSCTVKTTTAGVRYRKCPKTSCDIVGQYASKGAKVKIACVTTGTKVNGETLWVKASTGYYVSGAYLTSVDACGPQYLC